MSLPHPDRDGPLTSNPPIAHPRGVFQPLELVGVAVEPQHQPHRDLMLSEQLGRFGAVNVMMFSLR